MLELDAKVTNLGDARKDVERKMKELMGAPMVQTVRNATLLIQRSSRINAPVDTGRLRASITPSVVSGVNEIQGIVGSNVKYAPYMELGTRPHWPPIAALETWARSHGTSAFLVARAIARHGTKARRYLQRAFEENAGRVKVMVEQTIKRISES